MDIREFYIKNKSPIMQSMLVAGIFILFELITLLSGANPFSEWGALEFVFLPISILVVSIDTIDWIKIRNNKLLIRLDQDGVHIHSYMFSKKFIPYVEMSEVNLREKDIEYVRNGKHGSLGGPTQSDLIRMMKVLRDNIGVQHQSNK